MRASVCPACSAASAGEQRRGAATDVSPRSISPPTLLSSAREVGVGGEVPRSYWMSGLEINAISPLCPSFPTPRPTPIQRSATLWGAPRLPWSVFHIATNESQCIPNRAGGPPHVKVLYFFLPRLVSALFLVAVDTFLTSFPTVTLCPARCVPGCFGAVLPFDRY